MPKILPLFFLPLFLVCSQSRDRYRDYDDEFYSSLRYSLLRDRFCYNEDITITAKQVVAYEKCTIERNVLLARVQRYCESEIYPEDPLERRQYRCNDTERRPLDEKFEECIQKRCEDVDCWNRAEGSGGRRGGRESDRKRFEEDRIKSLKCKEKAMGMSSSRNMKILTMYFNSINSFKSSKKRYCVKHDLPDDFCLEAEKCSFNYKYLTIDRNTTKHCREKLWPEADESVTPNENRRELCSGEDYARRMEEVLQNANAPHKAVPVHYQCYIETDGRYNPHSYEMIEQITKERDAFEECIEKAMNLMENRRKRDMTSKSIINSKSTAKGSRKSVVYVFFALVLTYFLVLH